MRVSSRVKILLVIFLLSPLAIFSQSKKVIRPKFGEYQKRTSNLIPYRPLKRPRVALVLSGGGARGISQIGVLKTLEKYDIPIDFIVGTSMGGVIGGLYALGYSTEQLKSIVDTTNWDETLSLTDEAKRSDLFVDQKQTEESSFLVVRFDGIHPIIPSAISTGQRLTNFINKFVLQGLYHPGPTFDDLKIPLRVVTTDLVSGKRVILGSGDLTETLRASTTVPLLFTPVKKDSMLLIDGGLTSNIPVDVAKDLGYDVVIAVNTTSGFRSADQLEAPWQTADQIISIMQQTSNQLQLQKADVVIAPNTGNHLSSDFTQLDSLIAIGERATQEKIGEILPRLRGVEYHRSGGSSELMNNLTIEFRGDPVPDSLKQRILARQSLAEFEVDLISKALIDLYQVGDYQDVYAEIETNGTSTNVVYVTVRTPVLSGVQFRGNHLLSQEELRTPFDPLIGNVINHGKGRKAIEVILQKYRDRGYSTAKIDSIDFDQSSHVATLWIDEGKIQKIQIQGNERTKDFVILREFPLSEGDVFSVSEATRGVTNISSTNLFEQVLLNVRYEESKSIVTIKVKEKSSELLRIGVRADNERNGQMLFDLRNENLFGTGTEIGFTFAGGARNRLYRLEYKSNRIFSTYFTFNLKGYSRFRDIFTYLDGSSDRISRWTRIQVGDYRQLKYGVSFTLGTQVERLGNVTMEAKVEHHEISGISGIGYNPGKFQLVSLKLASTLDTQNRFLFPTDGVFLDMSYEFAFRNFGGDVSYSKIFFTYEFFTTYLKGHTLHPKITVGFADETLPLSEQFSIGGQQSFFGLREDDARGRQIFLINVEYRWQLPIKIIFESYLKLRYDVGAIWAIPQDIRLKDFRHGVGMELSLDTPIGPAEFGVGRSFRFRRDLPDNPISLGPYNAYFSIGYRLHR